MAATQFISIPGTLDGVKAMLDRADTPLVLVSRHGLGDNILFSPCLEVLKSFFGRLFFCSCVNAYASIFHDSPLVQVLYLGSVNGADLGLNSPEGFREHFEQLKLDLGCKTALVYHFGLFEPPLPYEDERAFVKGRRNYVELFGTAPPATETPRYHVAPDEASRSFVANTLGRWLPERQLVSIARYGHTDGGKNLGDDYRQTVRVAKLIEQEQPGQFKFLSFDYTPGEHAADGRLPFIRSIYGFLPCDAASMHHVLSFSRLLITVPSGPMLVGASIPTLKLLTLWKTMPPFHFLDPQFASANPVHALVEREDLACERFMEAWPAASKQAVRRRWRITVTTITPEAVAEAAMRQLDEP